MSEAYRGVGEWRGPRDIHLIRHGESTNNWLYRESHRLFPCSSASGIDDTGAAASYVLENRSPDPFLSPDVGVPQAELLGSYLGPLLSDLDVIVVSPMRRALLTIAPSLAAAASLGKRLTVIVDAEYYEMGGLYVNGGGPVDESFVLGLNRPEMLAILNPVDDPNISVSFVAFRHGFASDEKGWHTGPRSGHESTFLRVNRFVVRFLDLSAQLPVHGALYCVGHGELMSFLLSSLLAPHCGNHALAIGLPPSGRPVPGGGGGGIPVSPPLPFGGFVFKNSSITSLKCFSLDTFLCTSVGLVPHLLLGPSRTEPQSSNLLLLSGGDAVKDGWHDCVRAPDPPLSLHLFKGSGQVPPHLWSEVVSLRAVHLWSVESGGDGGGGGGRVGDAPLPTTFAEDDDRINVHALLLRGGRVAACGQVQLLLREEACGVSASGGGGGERPAGATARLRQCVVRGYGRGRGWGKCVVEALEDHARTEGAGEMVVHAWTRSKAFYEKVGFKEKGKGEGGEGIYWSNGMECIKLFKQL